MKLNDLMNYYEPSPIPLEDQARKRILASVRVPETKKPKGWLLRVGLIAAVIVVLLTGTVLAVMRYTRITDSMEENWNARVEASMTEEHKEFIEQRSADIGESVMDQGITITVDSVSATNDTVYLVYTAQLEDANDNLVGIAQDDIQVTTSDGNTYSAMAAVADQVVEGGDSGKSYYRILTFDLPEDVTLSKGQLNMEIHTLTVNDMEQVNGTWSYAFELPECETVEEYNISQAINFPDGANFEISNISISASRITFDYRCNIVEAMLLDGDAFTIEEIRAADPEVQYIYVFYARLSDGTTVPVTGGNSVFSESRQVNECEFYWSVPIDLSALESIEFSDGTMATEINLTE